MQNQDAAATASLEQAAERVALAFPPEQLPSRRETPWRHAA
jgi:hypothetical protein